MENNDSTQRIQSLYWLLLYQAELIKSYQTKEEALTNFAYSCAHDLKEPLRNISLFIQLLKESTKENRNAAAEEYMQYILHNTADMHGLIDTIMEHTIH